MNPAPALSHDEATLLAGLCGLNATLRIDLNGVFFPEPAASGIVNTRWDPVQKPAQFGLVLLCAAREEILVVPHRSTATGPGGKTTFYVGAVRGRLHSEALAFDPDDTRSFVTAVCSAIASLLLRNRLANIPAADPVRPG